MSNAMHLYYEHTIATTSTLVRLFTHVLEVVGVRIHGRVSTLTLIEPTADVLETFLRLVST